MSLSDRVGKLREARAREAAKAEAAREREAKAAWDVFAPATAELDRFLDGLRRDETFRQVFGEDAIMLMGGRTAYMDKMQGQHPRREVTFWDAGIGERQAKCQFVLYKVGEGRGDAFVGFEIKGPHCNVTFQEPLETLTHVLSRVEGVLAEHVVKTLDEAPAAGPAPR